MPITATKPLPPSGDSRKCEKCGASEDIKPTLTMPYAQYWRCSKCGHIWTTPKAAATE